MGAIVAHISSTTSSDSRNDEQTYVHAALIKQIIASRSALSRFPRTWNDRWMLSPLCHSVVRCLGELPMTLNLRNFISNIPTPVNCNRGTSTTQTHDRLGAFKCNHQLSPSRCRSVWNIFFSTGNWIANTQNFDMHCKNCYRKIFNENFPFFSLSNPAFCSANRTILLCRIKKQCRT